MNKTLISLLTVVIVMAFGVWAFTSYLKPADQEAINDFEPYRATLMGEYVCLSTAAPGMPSNGDCPHGLRTNSGELYAVDFALMSQLNPGLQIGQRFSANGLVTPIERISSDHWRQYGVKGIFSVTDSVSIEADAETKDTPPKMDDNEPIMCTMDAKICPDGSAVGRQGPYCEFAPCPDETNK